MNGRPDFSAWVPPSSYWVPPMEALGLECLDNSIKAGNVVKEGPFSCITVGEAICFDNKGGHFGQWTFGIKEMDNGMTKACLWDPKNEEAWCLCNGERSVTQICIGEDTNYAQNRYSQERPYLVFYNENRHEYVGELTCDGTDGDKDKNLGKPTMLRMVDNSKVNTYAKYPIPVVKLKKGKTEDLNDEDGLWQISVDAAGDGTFAINEFKCDWNDMCPSDSPSLVPSLSLMPSQEPTTSMVPSFDPSIEPSVVPSDAPSYVRSETPSGKPSGIPTLSPITTPSVQPSSAPSKIPSADPTISPTSNPTMSAEPSAEASASPSSTPSTSMSPSSAPTDSTSSPSNAPSQNPTFCPTESSSTILPKYWAPPLDKPGMACNHKRLKILDHGELTCMSVGEGICRDNGGYFGKWRFGIEEVERGVCNFSGICPQPDEFFDASTFPVLIDPATNRYPLTGTTYTDSRTGEICKNENGQAIQGCNYAGTTHICIGENIDEDPTRYSGERPYMFFYNEKTHMFLYQIVCDAVGEEGRLPQLKMINNGAIANDRYVKYPVDIVRFKKGPLPNPDENYNSLWSMQIDWNGFKDSSRQVGELAAFIKTTHPSHCKQYVSATSTACWEVGADCSAVATPELYERDNCVL